MGAPLEEAYAEAPGAVFYSTNDWFRRGYWYSQQDIVVLLRTDLKNMNITANTDASFTNNPPRLTSKTVTPTYAPGTRLTLGRFLGQDVANRDYTLEVAFLGLFDYTERANLQGNLKTILGPTNEFRFSQSVDPTTGIGILGWVVTGDPVPGFSVIQLDSSGFFFDDLRQDVLYSSDLNSLELNLRVLGRPLRDRIALQPNGSWVRHGTPSHLLSGLIGLRGLSINELFRYQSNSVNSDLDEGTYQVQTQNDMFGIQIGADLSENYARWSWGGRFKAGSLYNFADRRSNLHWRIDRPDLGVSEEFSNSEKIDKENLAIVVEGGLMATWQMRANLSARIAYDAMYVTGIGVATENLRIDSTFPPFETTSNAIYHGLSVGFEMLW